MSEKLLGLSADGWIAALTCVLAVATIGLMGATIWLAYSTMRLWQDTRLQAQAAKVAADAAVESNRITRELFVMEKRPWIEVGREIDGLVVETGDGAELRVVVHARNVGHTPAMNVTVRFVASTTDYAELRESMRVGRDAAHSFEPEIGNTVFPGKTHSEGHLIQVGPIRTRGPEDAPLIAGWVQYEFSPGTGWHFTPFAFALMTWRGADANAIERAELRAFRSHFSLD